MTRAIIVRQVDEGLTVHLLESTDEEVGGLIYAEEKVLGQVKRQGGRWLAHKHGAVGMDRPTECETSEEAVDVLVRQLRG